MATNPAHTEKNPRPWPHIVTNMAFWQSAEWTRNADSIINPSRHPDNTPCGLQALRLFFRRKHYDVVLTMGARESLAYGLLCWITGRTSRQVMTEVFVDDENASNPFWHLKTALYRLISKRAIGLLTNSSSEVETVSKRFCVSSKIVRYVPMHTNILQAEYGDRNEGFVLTAGYTRRDYPTLLNAATHIDTRIIIICSHSDLQAGDIPGNVTILRDIPRQAYLDYLRRAAVVVLPLQPTERSTGQVVLLEAMALGKPVVATRTPGTLDHIRHNENGLFVAPHDAPSLAREVNSLLQDPATATRLGRRAFEDILRFNTVDIHAKAKLAAITELWEQRGRGAQLREQPHRRCDIFHGKSPLKPIERL